MSHTQSGFGQKILRGGGIAGVMGLSFLLWSSLFVQVRDVEVAMAYPYFEVGGEPLAVATNGGEVVRGRIRPGQSMFTLLGRYGLSKGDVMEVVHAAKPVKDLARVNVGQSYRVKLDKGGKFSTFEVDVSPTRVLAVSTTPFGYVAEEGDIAFEMRLKVLSGSTRRGSLFSDLMKMKGGSELTRHLQDVFAWEVDFNRDIRSGDSFKVLVEEVWRDGEFDHFGVVRFAQIKTQGQTIEAINYKGEFYDLAGRTLRRALLPAPVAYRYISSRFSNARRHPIHGRVRPHYGVDYVASYGTPVRAAGDGVVNFVGWKGDNGRMISVRHKGAYRTVYSHLSRFDQGLKRGAKVQQGEIIGYVGNSGASTGTHLHFGVYKHGRPVNPQGIDHSPIAKPVDLASTPGFMVAWDEARLTIDRYDQSPFTLVKM